MCSFHTLPFSWGPNTIQQLGQQPWRCNPRSLLILSIPGGIIQSHKPCGWPTLDAGAEEAGAPESQPAAHTGICSLILILHPDELYGRPL